MDGRGIGRTLGRAMRLRCPLCGEGRIFRGMTAVRHCPICGFQFEREAGYWSNAAALNYMVTGGFATTVIAPLAVLTRWSLPLMIALALTVGAGLSLACFRHGKSVWLAMDVLIRPPSEIELLEGFLHKENAARRRTRDHAPTSPPSPLPFPFD